MQSSMKPSAQNKAGKMHQKKPEGKRKQNKGNVKEVALIDYNYKPSSPAHIRQGFKGGREPKAYIKGGNGTYLCYGDSPQVMITLKEAVNGEILEEAKTIEIDAYSQLKDQLTEYGGERLSEKRVDKIMSHLEGTTFNITKKGGKWMLPKLDRHLFKR